MRNHITLVRGDSEEFEIVVRDSSGEPTPLEDSILFFTVKDRLSAPDTSAIIRKWSGNGITHSQSDVGQAVLEILPQDTATLTGGRRTFSWDIQIINVGGKTKTLARGLVEVVPDVTRSIEPPGV